MSDTGWIGWIKGKVGTPLLLALVLLPVVVHAAPGDVDLTFDPGSGANDAVWSVDMEADGKVVIGGRFTTVNGVERNGIARLNADGSLDTGFDAGLGGTNAAEDIRSVALQPDGKVVIGVYRDGRSYLDLNGNDQWDGCGMDGCYVFGSAEDQAIVGDWTRSGQAMLGVYRGGGWYLDLNGNNQWDGCGVDGCYVFGSAGDIPAN